MQLSIQQDEEDLVVDVEAVLLRLVRRQRVLVGAEVGVIAPAFTHHISNSELVDMWGAATVLEGVLADRVRQARRARVVAGCGIVFITGVLQLWRWWAAG